MSKVLKSGRLLGAVCGCGLLGVANLANGRTLSFWVPSDLSLRHTNEMVGGGRGRRVLFELGHSIATGKRHGWAGQLGGDWQHW